MKTNNWVRVEDGLPELYDITAIWTMSEAVLVYSKEGYPMIAHLNYNKSVSDKPIWMYIGKDTVTHWMYIKPPKEYDNK